MRARKATVLRASSLLLPTTVNIFEGVVQLIVPSTLLLASTGPFDVIHTAPL